jgi:hypothetical protein
MQVTVYPRGGTRTVLSGPLGIPWGGDTPAITSPKHMSEIGTLTSVNFSTRYEEGFGGHDLADWTVTGEFGGYIGGMFRPGDHVRIVRGGVCWEGEYSEATPNADGSVTMHAKGYAYNLYDYDSIYWNAIPGDDDIFYPTTQLGTPGDDTEPLYGWTYAIYELGMPIAQVVGTMPNGPIGGSVSNMSPTPVKVGTVLTSLCQAEEKRWAVWARSLVIAADDMTPMWSFAAPEAVVAVADTEYVTDLAVWYVKEGPAAWNGATDYDAGEVVLNDGTYWEAILDNTGITPVDGSTWKEITYRFRPSDFSFEWAHDAVGKKRFDVRTEVVDYRGLGKILDVDASRMASSLLTQVKARWTLTGSFTIDPDSGFASASGGDAGEQLAFIRAGRALELKGLRTSQGNLMPDGDVVMIGQTDYSWSLDGEDEKEELTVTPMGTVARDFTSVLTGVPLDATSVAISGRRTTST